jgi:hypothetical protein
VIGLGLRQVQEALNRRADACQRDFVQLSGQLDDISRQLSEVPEEERPALRARQAELREEQRVLADEINAWRERARAVLQQGGQAGLREYLNRLLELNDPAIAAAAQHALYVMDAPEEELLKLSGSTGAAQATTPAGRLLARARTEYDLRGSDTAPRRRAAAEFANRQGMGQDDQALAEIEAAMTDDDPVVREVATLTAIQLHKFRAVRVADLDVAHASVLKLAAIQDRSVLPTLIEIVEKSRTGYVNAEGGSQERDNGNSRLVALLRLVEWHTPDAKIAVQARMFDRDPQILKAAERALELFPGEWTGPIKKKSEGEPAG